VAIASATSTGVGLRLALADGMTTFFGRVAGAALLRPAIYEEVEADRSATLQAGSVVVLSSLAAGVGTLGQVDAHAAALASISFVALASWVIWAVLTLQIGARIFPAPRTQADLGQLLRTLGFASAPGILRVAGLAPGMTSVVFAVTAVWMLVAMVVAVRQALEYTSLARAVAVCAFGWVLAIGFAFALGTYFAPPLF